MSKHHGGLGARWERTRRTVFDRAGYRCESCGLARPLEAHHVEPLHAVGAVYDMTNLRALCRDCHRAAHARIETPQRKRWRRLCVTIREIKGA